MGVRSLKHEERKNTLNISCPLYGKLKWRSDAHDYLGYISNSHINEIFIWDQFSYYLRVGTRKEWRHFMSQESLLGSYVTGQWPQGGLNETDFANLKLCIS